MKTMISNEIVLNSYHELRPDYKICPFSNKDIFFNQKLDDADGIDQYLKNRFKTNYVFTQNGREAIKIALEFYALDQEDIVTILTSSSNFYISSCVTKEIEKQCKWSREIHKKTKILFVNHEFGYPYKRLSDLKKYSLPIIEDCAHSFFSEDRNNTIGKMGDFTIYSFPKMFPLQIGGLLVNNNNEKFLSNSKIDPSEEKYIKKVLSYHIAKKEQIICKRIGNYQYLLNKLSPIGVTPVFELAGGVVPGVFLFSLNDPDMDLNKLKEYYYANGVQCSVFYGRNAFFLPVHQALNHDDMNYFVEVLKSFQKSMKQGAAAK